MKLEEEGARTPGKIKIFKSISVCLTELNAQSEALDRERFIPFLDKEIRLSTQENGKTLNLSLDSLQDSETNAYPVERPHLVAVDFQLVYTFIDLEETEVPQRAVPHMTISGACLCSEEQGSISEIRLQKMALDKTFVNDEIWEVGIVFLDAREPLTRRGLR